MELVIDGESVDVLDISFAEFLSVEVECDSVHLSHVGPDRESGEVGPLRNRMRLFGDVKIELKTTKGGTQ